MIARYRQDFNSRYTPEKYLKFLRELERRCGTYVKFRCNETPCFIPAGLLAKMVRAGEEILGQLVDNADYLQAADAVIPTRYKVPAESDRPLFVQADFGIIRGADGEWAPRLVEIQGFPSLYAFQLTLANTYRDVYELDPSLRTLLSGLDETDYVKVLRNAIVGDHSVAAVVLAEIEPGEQKTLPDFLETERLTGVRTVDVREIRKEGRRLWYVHDGKRIPIARIYNRVIADELIRKDIRLAFEFGDDLDVEWAGNPNWYFRISKFSLPWLKHDVVPRTWFLDQVQELPLAPEQLVLKPLFSFAGLGVIVGPTAEEIAAAISNERRSEYILQERMDFAATINTPGGAAKVEIRIMYIWQDGFRPVNTIVRTGRGKMMGVDQNRNLDWVGASAAFFPATHADPDHVLT
jgi:hypothetical protein